MEQVRCFIPQTLNEALSIINETSCVVMAGGSDLMVEHKRTIGVAPNFDKPVLLIRNLKEIQEIYLNDKNECCIGAGCTSLQIMSSLIVPWHLRQAASRMGAVGLRNSATIGGNICNASPKGDTLGPLYLLDARVKIQSLNGVREEKVQDFILGFKKINLKDNEMVTQIILPLSENDFDYIFWHKVGTRKANAISKVTLSLAIKFNNDNTVCDFRIASTATGANANRSREVEQLLVGKQITEENIETVITAYDSVISPRAMAEFRRESIKRMIRHFLNEANMHKEEKVIYTK